MGAKEKNVVLCGANSYDQKYYFNPQFGNLPEQVKQELQILCVLFTEEVGGILTMQYAASDGTLMFVTDADEYDYLYDEVSCGLKLHQMQVQNRELFEGLEMYYRYFVLHEGEMPDLEQKAD